MDRIDLLFDLQGCITELQTAMVKKDWETATGYIHRHLQRTLPPPSPSTSTLSPSSSSLTFSPMEAIPESLLAYLPPESNLAKKMKESHLILESTRNELKKAIESAFKKASSQQPPNTIEIQRCFQLFPLMHEHSLGLTLYTDFLCQHLHHTCQSALRDLQPQQLTPSVYVTLLTKLYENMATLVDQTLMNIRQHYGEAWLSTWFPPLFEACSQQAIHWLTTWSDQRHLKSLVSQLPTLYQDKSNPTFTSTELSTSNASNPTEIELALTDLVVMLQRSFFYQRFLNARQLASSLQDSLYIQWLKDLTQQYVRLEETWYRINVEQALSMDQLPMNDSFSLVSSCVDDVFFLLKKSTLRALSTCAFVECTFLLKQFVQWMDQSLVKLLQRKATQCIALYKEDGLPETRRSFMVQLNNLNQLMLYMPKFIEEMESQLSLLLPDASPDKNFIDSAMALFNKLSHAQLPFLNMQLNAYFQFFFKSHIHTFLPLLQTNYSLTEDQYAEAVASNSFIGTNPKFTQAFHLLVGTTKNELVPGNFNSFLLILTDYFFKEWEKLLFSRKFTQFGALYLERDLRSLLSFFHSQGSASEEDVSMTYLSWTHQLREQFTRLQQFSMVVNLSQVTELYDYYGPQAMTSISWCFSPTQLMHILSLRVDFSMDSIQSLKLTATNETKT